MRSLDDFAAAKLSDLETRHVRRGLVETTRLDGVWAWRGGRRLLSFSCNDYLNLTQHPAVRQAAIAGYGIALLGDPLTINDIRTGRLMRLLPGYLARQRQAFIVYPSRRHLAQRTRVVIDYLVEEFRQLELRLRDSREWGENDATWLV